MNAHLETIKSLLLSLPLTDEQRQAVQKALADADKQWAITDFKLDRTEKVKRTTAILLEETIEELEQKRAAVEAQNRELEIESSLERVRTVAMSMKEPDDMLRVCSVISEQLGLLNVKAVRNVQTAIFYPAKGTYMNYEYYAKHEKTFITETTYSNNEKHTAFAEDMQKGGGQFFELNLAGDEVKEWIAYQKTTNVFIDDFLYAASSLHYYWCSFGPVALGMSTYEPLTESEKILFRRFSKVFELAYRRYLDIEKAGAQAIEAQIEAALERVRSRTMAMHQTSELQGVIHTVHKELLNLKLSIDGGSFVVINEYVEPELRCWGSGGTADTSEEVRVPHFDLPFCTNLVKGIKVGPGFFTEEFSQEEKKEYFTKLFEHKPWSELSAEQKNETLSGPGGYTRSVAVSTHTSIFIINHHGIKFTEAENDILKRFAKVFEQTYTRFLDLQMAEAQARESKIEAALEKVRSRSLAMHHSDEIGEVVWTVIEKMKELDIEMGGISIVTFKPGSNDLLHWYVNPEQAGNSSTMSVPYFDNLVFNDTVEAKEKGMELLVKVYSKEEKNAYFNAAVQHTDFKYFPGEIKQWLLDQPCLGFSYAIQKHSGIYLEDYTGKFFTPEENNILIRFSRVFEQSYVRFLDLQKAEAQTREAQVEAALERVRSRTLAMQKSDELTETAAVLFQQLILLGIAPVRLYIGVVKDEEGQTEFWITDENGGKVRSAFEVNLKENASFRKMLEGWRAGEKSLVVDMRGEELHQYLAYLSSISVPFNRGRAQERRIQYVAFFGKGFIGMASPDEQPPETIELLERFAYTFNLTFTRFNDLQLAEAHALQSEQDLIQIKAARQRAEEALSELQVTQKQLIQSEKMASLGELTAGIAHEIQNPLNFVNNFSEVSNELLEEMIEELATGNWQLATEIAADVKQNLEKIAHHGKRADGIVKGMLQHSRASSGRKEPTDINALADEYLRLAYHGLRAKDKSFNATLQTDYDEAVGKVAIIPQDIGRVILNLITNAFYAVGEKKKEGHEGYVPTVSVSTKRVGDKAEMRVRDNGGGIPQSVVDKIFQPFFTTKPTGQGTGLGLSLAYDIVKAHGGKLAVETTGGEGTIFFVSVPIE